MKVNFKKTAGILAASLILTAGYVQAATYTSARYLYNSNGYTDTLKGKSGRMEVTAKANEKALGQLQINDPYLWHTVKELNFKAGNTTTTKFVEKPNYGSKNAVWRCYGMNCHIKLKTW